MPFEFMATDVTSPRCEVMVRIQTPETRSQNLIVLSLEPLTMRLPIGFKITLETARWCPLNVLTTWPVVKSWRRTILSYPPETTWLYIKRKEKNNESHTVRIETDFNENSTDGRVITYTCRMVFHRVNIAGMTTKRRPTGSLGSSDIPNLDRRISTRTCHRSSCLI